MTCINICSIHLFRLKYLYMVTLACSLWFKLYDCISFLKQLLYETCLCIWLLSFYEPGIVYLATSRSLQRLIEVVKGSTKEKVSFWSFT